MNYNVFYFLYVDYNQSNSFNVPVVFPFLAHPAQPIHRHPNLIQSHLKRVYPNLIQRQRNATHLITHSSELGRYNKNIPNIYQRYTKNIPANIPNIYSKIYLNIFKYIQDI